MLCKPPFLVQIIFPELIEVYEKSNYSLNLITPSQINKSTPFNYSGPLKNQCCAFSKNLESKRTSDTILGVSFGLSSASFYSFLIILIRKMNMRRVDFSLSTIYSSFFAIPITIVMSVVLFFISSTKRDPALFNDALIFQSVYALIAAFAGILQIVFLNLALKYEKAQTIAIIGPTDLVFGFWLQYLLLDIKSDLFGVVGALLIIVGTLLVVVYKVVETNYAKN